jgi:hypothetical protein
MGKARRIAALALLLGGCAEPLLAAHEPTAAHRPSRTPLIGTSTHPPAPRAANEPTAPEPPIVELCAVPDTTSASRDTRGANVPSDEAITRDLRVRLLSDPGLSSSARNVEITTENGVITLRGHVGTVRERDQIDAHAHGLRGVARVDDLLHVAR